MPVIPAVGYVTEAEVRDLPGMADTGKYPPAKIEAAREWFETIFERHTGMAFILRTATERLSGGCSVLYLKHWPVWSITAVRSYTSPSLYTSFTAPELADLLVDPTGYVRRYSLGSWAADTELDYTHGQDVLPDDVKDACLVAVREKLLEDVSGARGNRQFSVALEQGIVRNSTPGKDSPFGIPSVDAVANAYRSMYKIPAMA